MPVNLKNFYEPEYSRSDPLEKWPGMGKDGWIKYRLNRSYSDPYPESEIDVILNPTAPSEIVSLDQAAKNVVLDLANSYDNIYVAMSGGVDSEFVARNFLNQGIKFTPIICKIDDLNELDIWWAFKWCKENKVIPTVVKVTEAEWVDRIIKISKKYCGRFGAGNSTMSFVYDYVREQEGYLVTGAGFPEYFPDENLLYMQRRYIDSKMHDKEDNPKEGYLFHEPDVIQTIMYPEMPFNFLSWTPEIVLSYVYHRDMTKTSAENKAEMMKCLPRPKNIGVGNYVFRTNEKLARWMHIRNKIGTCEAEFLGTREEIIQMLTTGSRS